MSNRIKQVTYFGLLLFLNHENAGSETFCKSEPELEPKQIVSAPQHRWNAYISSFQEPVNYTIIKTLKYNAVSGRTVFLKDSKEY
jgi:hypothetical protein